MHGSFGRGYEVGYKLELVYNEDKHLKKSTKVSVQMQGGGESGLETKDTATSLTGRLRLCGSDRSPEERDCWWMTLPSDAKAIGGAVNSAARHRCYNTHRSCV